MLPHALRSINDDGNIFMERAVAIHSPVICYCKPHGYYINNVVSLENGVI